VSDKYWVNGRGREEMGTNDAELVEKEDPFITEISPV